MKKCVLVYVGVLLAVLLTAGVTQATVFVNHQGATDPSTEGFGTLFQSSDPPTPILGPVSGDLGYDAWEIDTTGTSGGYGYAGYQTSTEGWLSSMNADGWRLTAVLRVVDDKNPGDVDYGSCVWLKAGYIYGLRFGLNTNKTDTVITTIGGTSYTVSGTGYHTYVLLDGNKDTLADLYIDGVLTESNVRGASTEGDDRLWFGDGTSNWGGPDYSNPLNADTHFNVVKVETVPEPVTLSLLMIALAGLGLRKRS